MRTKIIFLFLLLASLSFAQNKIIFEKKKNHQRTYEIQTPAYCDVIFLNGRIDGYISAVRDSVLVMRIFNPGKIESVKDKMTEAKKIKKNKTLSSREKEAQLVKYIYRDSLQLPVSAVKQIKFYTAQKRSKYFLAYAASFVIAAAMTELYVKFSPPPSSHDATEAFILAGGFSAILFADYNLFVKRINPRKWQIKK